MQDVERTDSLYFWLYMFELSTILTKGEEEWNMEKQGKTHALNMNCFIQKYLCRLLRVLILRSRTHSTHICPLYRKIGRLTDDETRLYKKFYTASFVFYYCIICPTLFAANLMLLWETIFQITTLEVLMCSIYYYMTLVKYMIALSLYFYGSGVLVRGIREKLSGTWLKYAFRCTISDGFKTFGITADIIFSVFWFVFVLYPGYFNLVRPYNLFAAIPVMKIAYMALPWLICIRLSFDVLRIQKTQGNLPFFFITGIVMALIPCVIIHLIAIYQLPNSVVISCIKGEIPS